MAIYEHGLLGPIQGKVGPTVGTNWRGIHYMRSLAEKSKKPATEKQLATRLKFKMASKFLTPMRDIIRIFPKGKTNIRKTDFNEAASIIIKNIKGEYPNFTIPFEEAVFTRGSLMGVFPSVEVVDDVGIKVSWSTRLGRGASYNDEINILVFDSGRDDYYHLKDSIRSDGEKIITLEGVNEGIFHVWTFVSSSNDLERSNSRYCGMCELKAIEVLEQDSK